MSDSQANKSDKNGPGISFKLSSSSRSGQSNIKPAKNLLDKEEVDNSNKKDYLLSVEGNKLQAVIPAPAVKEFIVPLIKTNNWRMKEKLGKKENQNGVSNKEDDEAASAILKDLRSCKFIGGSATGENEETDGLVIPLLMQNKPPVELSDDKLNDLEIRPEQSSIDDYDDMPIDQFGAAMLKGMGWKPGEAIGLNKKGLLEPIEYIAHPGGLGLGASKPPIPTKKNKIKKPGEIERKRPMPYKDKDGRVKHIKTIGEEIPEAKPEGYFPGNYGRVISGPHAGLRGKIIGVDEDNARVVIKLDINKQDLTFSQHNIELLSSDTPTQKHDTHGGQQHSSSKKQYGLVLPGNKESSNDDSKYDRPPNTSCYDHGRNNNGDKPRRDRVREETGSHSNDQRDKHYDRKRIRNDNMDRKEDTIIRKKPYPLEEDERVDYVKKKVTKMVATHKDVVKESKGKMKDCWLRAQLIVRIIDKHYKKGIYYNKKVLIVDVVDPVTCICQTDDKHLLEDVHLNMLETVIPKMAESIIIILNGKFKGQLGQIIDRNKTKCIASVQLLQTKQIIEIDYDYMCEYVGETYL